MSIFFTDVIFFPTFLLHYITWEPAELTVCTFPCDLNKHAGHRLCCFATMLVVKRMQNIGITLHRDTDRDVQWRNNSPEKQPLPFNESSALVRVFCPFCRVSSVTNPVSAVHMFMTNLVATSLALHPTSNHAASQCTFAHQNYQCN